MDARCDDIDYSNGADNNDDEVDDDDDVLFTFPLHDVLARLSLL